LVALLYGNRWSEVAGLLPPAAAVTAAGAVLSSTSRLLLANESRTASLIVELLTALGCIALAFWLLPEGLSRYLWALAIMTSAGAFTGLLLLYKSRAADLMGMTLAIVPPACAAGIASAAVLAAIPFLEVLWLPARLAVTASLFGLIYLVVLFIGQKRTVLDLLSIIPRATG